MSRYSLALLFLTFPAFSTPIEKSCKNIGQPSQIAQCAECRKYQSNKLLNSSYKTALDRIRQQYKQEPLLADQYISLLREAQRGWIKLRDADCKLEAFEIEETAEAYQVTIDNCLSRMSNDRAAYLKRIAPDI